MSDDILDHIDAAVEAAREDRCACGCRRRLKPGGPSPYFAGPDCQTSWHLQQQAIAEGKPERAEEMCRQRGEDPIARLRRRTMELGASDEGRAERHRRRLRVADWLRANDIDPSHVADGQPILTTPSLITVHDFTRDEGGRPRVAQGEVPTVEVTYPLIVPWPADLEWEHHRHELDDDAVNDRPIHAVLTNVARAVRLLGRIAQTDAVSLPSWNPLAYRIRCSACGRRGTPADAWVYPTQDGGTRMRWTCDCGAAVSTTDFTASVERFSQADGLHLRLGYGGETVHYVLPEHQYGHHVSLDPIWREMEQLLATSVRLPWSDPRSNPLQDVREVAERAQLDGAGIVSIAPAGTPPGDPGWADLGYISGTDGLEPAGEVVVGFDAAADRSTGVVVGYHNDDGRIRSWDLSASTHERFASRWREIVLHFQLSAGRAAAVMPLFGAAVRGTGEAMNPLLRAIEAKKNQAHGPQRKKRAPRRIDPRRGR